MVWWASKASNTRNSPTETFQLFNRLERLHVLDCLTLGGIEVNPFIVDYEFQFTRGDKKGSSQGIQYQTIAPVPQKTFLRSSICWHHDDTINIIFYNHEACSGKWKSSHTGNGTYIFRQEWHDCGVTITKRSSRSSFVSITWIHFDLVMTTKSVYERNIECQAVESTSMFMFDSENSSIDMLY